MEKTYTEPKFVLVKTDEDNRVFSAASGGGPSPATATATATLGTMTNKSIGSW